MSTQTSQPLFMPSLHHNLKTIFSLTSFYKYPSLQFIITNVLHFCAPFRTFPYFSGLEAYLGPPPARFRAHFLVHFRTRPAFVGPVCTCPCPFLFRFRSDQERIERHGLPCQLNLTFDSIRLRIHAPCLICATKNNNDNNNSMHFFSAPPLFFFLLFCNVIIVLCFRFPPSVSIQADRISAPEAEKSPSELLEMSSTSWTNGSTKCSE